SSSTTQRLAADLTAQGAVLTDSTDGVGMVSVRGSLAREVLSKGCGLDFHPQAFAVGRCARVRFAQMGVVVTHEHELEFRLYVARSYLQYLADWLADAAVEFKTL
ncbi:sarcosine oxidase subunit gamma, partial [Steroidobacter sp.]|uniref:sarcosine oxidase subunit gamma n=1 Tax=Steroidobacter sp. TaxID=1978227 RepID=UPI001A3D7986